MTFEEILDQALDMLRRRGRVTYGALKRQFALDDAYVADLKDAMLYADSHVVDDAGRGLRWTGEPLSAAQRAFEGVGRFYGAAGVLWLVRALLQHEGRVSYRTLNRSSALTRPGWRMSERRSCSRGAPLMRMVRGSSGGGGHLRTVPWARLPMCAFQPPPIALSPLPQRPPVALLKPNDGS